MREFEIGVFAMRMLSKMVGEVCLLRCSKYMLVCQRIFQERNVCLSVCDGFLSFELVSLFLVVMSLGLSVIVTSTPEFHTNKQEKSVLTRVIMLQKCLIKRRLWHDVDYSFSDDRRPMDQCLS